MNADDGMTEIHALFNRLIIHRNKDESGEDNR